VKPAYQRLAWAILFRKSRVPALEFLDGRTAGILAWGNEPESSHLRGCRAALFQTRKEARDAARKKHNPAYWPLRVARVMVTIEEIRR